MMKHNNNSQQAYEQQSVSTESRSSTSSSAASRKNKCPAAAVCEGLTERTRAGHDCTTDSCAAHRTLARYVSPFGVFKNSDPGVR